MSEDERLVFWACFAIGIVTFVVGVFIQTGSFKNWWFLKSSPVAPVQTAFVAIPISLCFFMGAILVTTPNQMLREYITYLIGVVLVVVVILSVWQPRLLVPRWLRWLEDHHRNILPLLKDEAQKMGEREWEKRVHTQTGLEEWVAEVRRKHNLPQ